MFSESTVLSLLGIVNTVAKERGIKPFNSGNIFSDLEEAALTLSGNHKAAGTATVAKLQPSAGKPAGESELLSAYSATDGDPVARAQFLARNEKSLRELVRSGSDARPAMTDESIVGQYNALTPQQRAEFVAKNEAALRTIASQHSN
jgi:hypothetical protein